MAEDYTDCIYQVAITVPTDGPYPTDEQVQVALYQGLEDVETKDAVLVERVG